MTKRSPSKKNITMNENKLIVEALDIRWKKLTFHSRTEYIMSMVKKADPGLMDTYKELVANKQVTITTPTVDE